MRFGAVVRAPPLGDTPTARSRRLPEGWLAASKPGLHRLRAAMPAGWEVGDKTGTGLQQMCDGAIVRPPGRAPLMSAFYDAPGVTFDTQQAVLRRAGASFVQWAVS